MPEVILKNLPFMLQGLTTSLQISAMVAVGGTLLGLLVAVGLSSRVPVLSGCSASLSSSSAARRCSSCS